MGGRMIEGVKTKSLKVIPDVCLLEVDVEQFDALAIPGGFGNWAKAVGEDDLSAPGIWQQKLLCRSEKPAKLAFNNLAIPWLDFSDWLWSQL